MGWKVLFRRKPKYQNKTYYSLYSIIESVTRYFIVFVARTFY